VVFLFQEEIPYFLITAYQQKFPGFCLTVRPDLPAPLVINTQRAVEVHFSTLCRWVSLQLNMIAPQESTGPPTGTVWLFAVQGENGA